MDEIQYALERDLAIGNVDRESTMLRNVKAAAKCPRRQLWNVRGLRIGDQPETPCCRAVGAAVHPVPGSCRRDVHVTTLRETPSQLA